MGIEQPPDLSEVIINKEGLDPITLLTALDVYSFGQEYLQISTDTQLFEREMERGGDFENDALIEFHYNLGRRSGYEHVLENVLGQRRLVDYLKFLSITTSSIPDLEKTEPEYMVPIRSFDAAHLITNIYDYIKLLKESRKAGKEDIMLAEEQGHLSVLELLFQKIGQGEIIESIKMAK